MLPASDQYRPGTGPLWQVYEDIGAEYIYTTGYKATS